MSRSLDALRDHWSPPHAAARENELEPIRKARLPPLLMCLVLAASWWGPPEIPTTPCGARFLVAGRVTTGGSGVTAGRLTVLAWLGPIDRGLMQLPLRIEAHGVGRLRVHRLLLGGLPVRRLGLPVHRLLLR